MLFVSFFVNTYRAADGVGQLLKIDTEGIRKVICCWSGQSPGVRRREGTKVCQPSNFTTHF